MVAGCHYFKCRGVCVKKPGTVRPIIHFVNEIAVALGSGVEPMEDKSTS